MTILLEQENQVEGQFCLPLALKSKNKSDKPGITGLRGIIHTSFNEALIINQELAGDLGLVAEQEKEVLEGVFAKVSTVQASIQMEDFECVVETPAIILPIKEKVIVGSQLLDRIAKGLKANWVFGYGREVLWLMENYV